MILSQVVTMTVNAQAKELQNLHRKIVCLIMGANHCLVSVENYPVFVFQT
jgi:hypothetical protein